MHMNTEKTGPITWRGLVARGQAVMVTAALMMAVACPAWAGGFEYPGVRQASQILPKNMLAGPHFKVREKVVTYGYLDHWTVDSDFGVFEVTGDGALKALVKEIHAIAALRKISGSDAFVRSLKESAMAPVDLAKGLIHHPVDTVSGIPKGVFQIFGNIGKAITMKHDPSEDSQIKQLLFVSSWKRDFAHDYGVDVYSSNKVLQKELNRVGWYAAIAGLSVSAVGAAASATAILVLKDMRLANQLGKALKEEPPGRLRIINEKKLAAMGVPKALSKKYLDNPYFTPRHDTIIVGSLHDMKGARGQGAFLKYLMSAKDEVAANFFQNMAETMRGYHEHVSPITDITPVGGFVVAKAANGSHMIPFPLDYGAWTSQAHRYFSYTKANYRDPGFNGKFDIWVRGTVTPLTRRKVTQMGNTITERVDQRIHFMD
jgi:hypothetical protein